MQKKLVYRTLSLIIMQLSHMTYSQSKNSLSDQLKELEIILVTLEGQTGKPISPKPSPQQKPIIPQPQPQKPSRETKPQQTRTTPVSSAPIVQVSTGDLGKQTLEFTNQFRAQNNKPPLEWNQKLADLSTEHSQNMASGKVPFSHAGFEDRSKHAGFKGTAENVYMTSSRPELAKNAVEAWINSPPHRSNMLGDYRFCGIGAYKNSKEHWYFTQMFGK